MPDIQQLSQSDTIVLLTRTAGAQVTITHDDLNGWLASNPTATDRDIEDWITSTVAGVDTSFDLHAHLASRDPWQLVVMAVDPGMEVSPTWWQ